MKLAILLIIALKFTFSVTAVHESPAAIKKIKDDHIISPGYHRAFQEVSNEHKTYFDLVTGLKTNDLNRNKYIAKGDLNKPLTILGANEKTTADRRKTQLYGLAHGLPPNKVFRKEDKAEVRKRIDAVENRMGRLLTRQERTDLSKWYCNEVGIASKQWFANRKAGQDEDRGLAGKMKALLTGTKPLSYGRKQSNGNAIELSSAEKSVAGAAGLDGMDSRGSVLSKGGKGPKRSRKNTKTTKMIKKRVKAVRQADESRSNQVKVKAPAKSINSIDSNPISAKQTQHYQSFRPNDVWVDRENLANEDLYDLFSPPITSHSPDHHHFDTHTGGHLYDPLHSPRFSGEDLRLPHGLRYADSSH